MSSVIVKQEKTVVSSAKVVTGEPFEIVDANAVLLSLEPESIPGGATLHVDADQGNDRQNWTNISGLNFTTVKQFQVANVQARYVRLTFSFTAGSGEAVVAYAVATAKL